VCGIGGIWHLTGRPVEKDRLGRMCASQAHRGPDGEGIWIEGNCGLVFRRLAILDLSDQALQPMQRNGLVAVYNGEIHNYVELRAQLEQQGYSFTTQTDTEVVLNGYHCWETDCFEKFNGMWSVAFWDPQRQILLLCRDRFGIKPLYYACSSGQFAFASEIKALLTAFPRWATSNTSEIASYLLGGNTDSGEATFHREIRAVPPSTCLKIDRNGPQTPVSYWGFEPGSIRESASLEEEFRELLTDAVRIRLRSDVPVGCCLSGGLDSSSVTQLASLSNTAPMHCFSLKYEDRPDLDESRFAELLMGGSDRFIPHWITPDPHRLVPRIQRIVEAHDAPVPIRGRLGLWSLMEETSRHVKVVMVGEGGDELLGGYSRFFWPYLFDRFRNEKVRSLLSPVHLKQDWQLCRGMNPSAAKCMLDLVRPWIKKSGLTLFVWKDFIGRSILKDSTRLDASRFFYTWNRKDLPHPFQDRLNNALWQEFRLVGLPELLRAGDAIGMSHSVEVRAPFLDHRLVEFCFRLPFSRKIGNGWTKDILRQSMRGILPPEVVYRRDKKGMPTPYTALLSQESNLNEIEQRLLYGRAVVAGYLDRSGVEKLLHRFRSASRNDVGVHCSVLWRCLNVELWLSHLDSFASRS